MEKLGWLRVVVFLTAFITFFMLFDTVMTIFFVTVLSSLMAIFFVGTADQIDRLLPGGRMLWISIMIMVILSTFGLIVWASFEPVTSQAQELGSEISPAVMQINQLLSRYGFGQDVLDSAGNLDLSGFMPDIDEFAFVFMKSLATFFVILVAGVFLSFEPGKYRDGLIFFSKDKKRTARVIDKLQDRLYRWTIGRLASMAVIFVLTWIGLVILGVPLAFLLAFVAGILSFIPNFGPIISAVLAAAVGLSVSPTLALWVLGLFLVVQLLESNLITPLVERRAVFLPPGLILLVQAFMGLAFGILGLIVATPITVGAVMILKEYQTQK